LRGADNMPAHPFADNILSADTTDTIASTGVTSTLPSQLIIVVGIGSDNASASMTSVTGTDPSSYTQRSFTTIATGADACGWFFDATRTAAGATGTVTQDFNSTIPAAGVFVAAVLNPPVPPLVTARART
jgi:DNA-binding transcriptional regulator LsrR (DeoR family)